MVEAVGDQHHADDEEERERQHLDRGMRGHEASDARGEGHHEEHRGDDCGDHDLDPIDHPDRGDDRVEREDDVDDHDRRITAENVALTAPRKLPSRLEQLVDLLGALPDQE
jgi:hypothetical protein